MGWALLTGPQVLYTAFLSEDRPTSVWDVGHQGSEVPVTWSSQVALQHQWQKAWLQKDDRRTASSLRAAATPTGVLMPILRSCVLRSALVRALVSRGPLQFILVAVSFLFMQKEKTIACKHALDDVQTVAGTRQADLGVTVLRSRQGSPLSHASALLTEIHFTCDSCPAYVGYRKRSMGLPSLN